MADKKDFGFKILSGRQVDMDAADDSFALELDAAVSAWRACINCGSCAATCPSGQNGGLNFRRLHYNIRMSVADADRMAGGNYPSQRKVYKDAISSLLTTCMLCGKCQLVCPRGIPTRYLSIQIMQKIRRYAEDIPSV